MGPQFVEYFGPVLRALVDLDGSARPREVRDRVAEICGVTDQQRAEAHESGALRFDNRVAWARFYLAKAGLIDSSQRGVWAITDTGRQHAAMSHQEALEIFASVHRSFEPESSNTRRAKSAPEIDPEESPDAPVDYRAQFLNRLWMLSPKAFEQFASRLLRESGFQKVNVTGRSGDGGIDGVGLLQINPLVAVKVLFQCKRYSRDHPIGPSVVRDFRGAMAGRSENGIIITTGVFTAEAARESVRDGVAPIELVDGEQLVNLCEELSLGLRPRQTYDLDERFFDSFDQ